MAKKRRPVLSEEEHFEMLRWCAVLARLGIWQWREGIIEGLNP